MASIATFDTAHLHLFQCPVPCFMMLVCISKKFVNIQENFLGKCHFFNKTILLKFNYL